MKWLTIFEYAGLNAYFVHTDLEAALRRQPNVTLDMFHGFLKKYRPGGLRPLRLLNLLYMHLALPFKILASKPDVLFVCTTPPLIQWSAFFWGRVFKKKIICWMFDYHPLIETRALQSIPWLRPFGKALDTLDLHLMHNACTVVVLDEGMAGVVRPRVAPSTQVITYPTWRQKDAIEVSRNAVIPQIDQPNRKSLRFVYCGNFGRGHCMQTLSIFLCAVSKDFPIEIFGLSLSPKGKKAFSQLAQALDVPYREFGFQPDIREFFEEHQIDYGIVLMRESLEGLISPSKFNNYVACGLPLIYMGPDGSNPAIVCERFHAGIMLREHSSVADIQLAAYKIMNPVVRRMHKANIVKACAYYENFTAEDLAHKLMDQTQPNRSTPEINIVSERDLLKV